MAVTGTSYAITPKLFAITTSQTNSGAIQITKSSHGLSTNDHVVVQNHLNTSDGLLSAANGEWVITVNDSNNFTLNGSTYAHDGGATGTVSREEIIEDITDSGLFDLTVDRTNQQNGDIVQVREYIVVKHSGPLVLRSTPQNYYDAVLQGQSMVIELINRGNSLTSESPSAIRYTLLQLGGTARSWDCTVNKYV